MKNIWKKMILVSTVCILVCVNIQSVQSSAETSTVSRAEWIHELVITFEMTVEDGLMPDDYYPDIKESDYYNDILLAVNFGVIDLEAGEQFCPDDPVTREFAVQTLNACLGYELDEQTSYTMNDYADLKYPQAAQIAINEKWLTLVNGAFEPEKTISTTEKTNMLNFAKAILTTTVIDDNHENVYEFADGVIEIPESTPVELLSPTEFVIYDTSLELSKDDWIAVYSNGIAYTYKVVEIDSQTDGLHITGEEISYDDAVVSVDAEGIIDADLSNFVPADGVDMIVNYEETAATYGLRKISGTKKIKDIVCKANVGGGTACYKLSNMKVEYRIDKKGYKFATKGTAIASYTISGKKDFTLNLGYINIAGVGKISVDMIYSADGSAALTYSYSFEDGIEKEYGSAPRKIYSYTIPTWHFSAKAELKTSCKIGFYLDVPSIANGAIYSEAGVKSEPDIEVYGDGKKPTTCMDVPAYVFANVGYNLSVLNNTVASEVIEVYNRNNSPVRICYHIEDGKSVSACTRPESSSRVGKRGYYSICDSGSGTYSANCFIAPFVDEVQPTFEYELDDDNNATITKYNGTVAYVTIPEELDGYPVVGIAKDVFKGNIYLQSVVIPDGVTYIGGSAFLNCKNLNSVVLSKSLVEMGTEAFGNCESLTSVEIPKSLTTCHTRYDNLDYSNNGPFNQCSALVKVTFESGIKQIASCLFAGCTGLERVEIPNSVTLIDKKAFNGCENLQEIVIPDSVTKVDWASFANCSNLQKLKMGNSVTYVGGQAFLNCKNLCEVTLSKSLVEMGSEAFGNCETLTSVEIPKSLTTCHTGYDNLDYSNNGPFNQCSALKTVTFESGIKQIASCLFAGCTGLEQIEIPNSVTLVDKKAFNGCESLQEIVIPDSVTKVDWASFANCQNLKEVYISNSVNSLGTYIFLNCTSLQKVHIPNIRINVTEGTFQNCTSLTEVNFPDTLETIGTNAFKNCTSLAEVNLPEKVNTINSNAFSHCEALTDLSIAEGVTSIGEKAFEYCIALEKVVLPDTLQTLGNYAFSYCDKLSDVNIGAGLKVIPNYCFYEDPALEKIVLPQQVTTINKYAFANCTGLKDITINRNVATIDTTAFSYPDKMTIHGVKGTYAETYASENGFTFNEINVPVTAIRINKSEMEIGRRETAQMTAEITPIDSSDELTWTSSDESIASIDSTGKLTANAIGAATIIAMSGNVIETCEVSVYEPVTSVSLNKTTYTGTTEDTLQLTSTVYPKNATYTAVQWTSSDSEVAEVTDTGLVTLKKYGTATITVKTENKSKTATCKVTVAPVAVTGVSLDSKTMTLGLGETGRLVATITPENATDKKVTWTSANPEVATVEDGLVVAVSEGKTSIIVKTKDGSKTALCTVTVTSTPAEEPTVVPSEEPGEEPTAAPTTVPTVVPSEEPGEEPTVVPSAVPQVEHTIYFDTNGGSVDIASLTTSGQSLPYLPTPTKKDVKFLGWYDEAGQLISNDTKFVKDTTVVAKWSKIVSIRVTKDKNVYLVGEAYDASDFKVTFVYEDGTTSSRYFTSKQVPDTSYPHVWRPKHSYTTYEGVQLIADTEIRFIKRPVSTVTVGKINKLKVTPLKKGMKLSWNKVSNASGYQIQISLKSNFKNAKTISVSKKLTSYKITKLKSGKKYYVRMRAKRTYKATNGKNKTIYSPYKKVSVKTK